MAFRLLFLLGFPLGLGLGVLCMGAFAAGGPPPDTTQFLQEHCLDCHEGAAAEAGFDLTSLSELEQGSVADGQAMSDWIRLYDRVQDGEMPPQDADQPPANELKSFLSSTGDWLRDQQQEEQARLGRVRARRLTNLQLERTLQDLLAIDIPLASLMPVEQRTDGFSNIADGQSMSHFQLESHLSVIDAALDQAFQRATDDDEAGNKDFSARQLCRKNPRQRCRDPEMIDGSAVVWSSTLVFYGRITSTTVPKSGWYRIKFSASAVNKPKDHGVWCTVRSGFCNSGAPLMSWIGSFEATDESEERTFEAWIPAGQMLEIRPGDETLKRARFQGGQVGAGEGGPQHVPGVALQSMTMQRIHPGGDVQTVRDRLFGDMQVKIDRDRLVFAGENATTDAVAQLRSFARLAFRRNPRESEIKSYVEMLEQLIADGADPIDALQASYRAILCSPRFLYLSESAGPLDDHAIASRLSYLLWNSMPDQELFALADAKKLRQQDVLRDQVLRMLEGPRAARFIADFASQWLDLIDIDFTEPDRKLYRDFDIVVQNAMLDETHAFLEDLLVNDYSVAAMIDCDHTYLNSRLARFYGIDGVSGESLRRVSLKPEHHRGGLMSQGSILKVTANGTHTSPVLRGVWISERILGIPIPPPPANVPAIEPDIRGAKTIREQLQKHLADTQCASCHQKIDPPGFALESFDAAGRWRDRYVNVDRGRSRPGAKIDSSATLADGRSFQDFDQFRELLLADPRPIAKNVAEKLLIYGTGAEISFADRETVEKIVEALAEKNYGFRSLLQAVVTSPTFLNK